MSRTNASKKTTKIVTAEKDYTLTASQYTDLLKHIETCEKAAKEALDGAKAVKAILAKLGSKQPVATASLEAVAVSEEEKPEVKKKKTSLTKEAIDKMNKAALIAALRERHGIDAKAKDLVGDLKTKLTKLEGASDKEEKAPDAKGKAEKEKAPDAKGKAEKEKAPVAKGKGKKHESKLIPEKGYGIVDDKYVTTLNDPTIVAYLVKDVPKPLTKAIEEELKKAKFDFKKHTAIQLKTMLTPEAVEELESSSSNDSAATATDATEKSGEKSDSSSDDAASEGGIWKSGEEENEEEGSSDSSSSSDAETLTMDESEKKVEKTKKAEFADEAAEGEETVMIDVIDILKKADIDILKKAEGKALSKEETFTKKVDTSAVHRKEDVNVTEGDFIKYIEGKKNSAFKQGDGTGIIAKAIGVDQAIVGTISANYASLLKQFRNATKPQGNKPQGNKPQGNKPQGNKPQGNNGGGRTLLKGR